jgi:hypothetical protein
MNRNKIGTLFFVSMLSLAGIGVGYAGLFDIITVHGDISTATVELKIEDYSGTWFYKIYGFPGIPPDPPGIPVKYSLQGEILVYKGYESDSDEYPGDTAVKDWAFVNGGVAELVAWAKGRKVLASDPTQDDGTPYDAVVEFWNVFPCFEWHADLDFHYLGSIPAKVINVDMDFTGDIVPLPPDGGQSGDWLKYLQNLDPPQFSYSFGNSPVADGLQLHWCDHLYFNVNLKIPQWNDFQGISGKGYLTVTVRQWNDDCDDTTEPKEVLLPSYDTDVTVEYYDSPDDSAYFKAVITNLPGGPYSPPLDGTPPITCNAWCVDQEGLVYLYDGDHYPYNVHMISSYDPMNPVDGQHYPADYDWPCVNWIINNKGAYTKEQIQNAIWYFVDGGYDPGSGPVHDLIQAALADGQNFVPEPGQNIAVLLIPDPLIQYEHWVYINGEWVWTLWPVQYIFIEVDP